MNNPIHIFNDLFTRFYGAIINYSCKIEKHFYEFSSLRQRLPRQKQTETEFAIAELLTLRHQDFAHDLS